MNPSDHRSPFEQPRAGAWSTPASQAAADPGATPPRRPDPGGNAWIAWIVFVLALLAVIGINQLGSRTSLKATQPGSAATVALDNNDQFALNAKLITRVSHVLVDRFGATKGELAQLSNGLTEAAKTDPDRVRAAMILADIAGTREALEYLDAQHFADSGPYAGDAKLLQQALRPQVEGADAAAMTPTEAAALKARYGWFAEVFLTRNEPLTNPARAKAVGGGGRLMAGIFLALGAGVVGFFGGIGAAVVLLVKITQGKIRRRFVPPMPGGSVFIETAAVFVVAFLAFHLLIGLIAGAYKSPPPWMQSAALAGQWGLIIVPFYPLLRGMKFGEWRRAIGWHSGQGVWKEIGAGLFGYFASLPILFLALVVTVTLVVVIGAIEQAMGHTPEPPKNPIADLVTGGSTLELVLIFALATVWAPLVEESIFRGALFRQLRGRLPALLAAVLSGLCFGLMHGYSGVLLIPVITIGFCFAMIREWRGSLIPTAVAHCLHNATILGIVLLILGGVG